MLFINRLEEAEERYANRDSRPEDLELIDQLREAIYDKEERIKALHVSVIQKEKSNLTESEELLSLQLIMILYHDFFVVKWFYL